MMDDAPLSLVELCQNVLLQCLEQSKFNGRMINDLCKSIPDQFLLAPIFEKLLANHCITDQALVAYLVPSRVSLRINAAPHIRNSVFKLIGLNCPHLVSTGASFSYCCQF